MNWCHRQQGGPRGGEDQKRARGMKEASSDLVSREGARGRGCGGGGVWTALPLSGDQVMQREVLVSRAGR